VRTAACAVGHRFVVIAVVFAACVGVYGSASAAEGKDTPAKKLRIVFFGAHCDDNELAAC
jgi:hypothetical protein